MSRTSKLVKNTAILSFGALCTKALMFIMTPIFTRWVAQDDYGTFDLLFTYATLLIPLATLSCGEAVFRYMLDADTQKSRKKIVSSATSVCIIGLSILTVLLLTLSCFWKDGATNIYLLIALVVSEAIYEFVLMICRGFKRMVLYAASNILFSIMMVASVTVFVQGMGMKLEGLIFGYTLAFMVASIVLLISLRIKDSLSYRDVSWKVIRKQLRYSIPLIPNSVSWWIVNVSDRTIVSIVLGTSSSAILAVANKIPNLCQTIFNVFHISWQESASESVDDKDAEEFYQEVFNSMTVVLISICAVILSLNYFIFNFLFEQEYFLGFYLTPILVVSIVVSMLSQFFGGIFIARKEPWKNGKTTLIAAAANIVTHLALVGLIGIYASVVSTLVSYLVLGVTRYRDIRKSYELRFSKLAIVYIMILLIFCALAYIDNLIVACSAVVVAIMMFLYTNRATIGKILTKLIGKFTKRSQC